jgi:hypothetical protein
MMRRCSGKHIYAMKKYIIPTIEQLEIIGNSAILAVSNPPQENNPKPVGPGNFAPGRKVF